MTAKGTSLGKTILSNTAFCSIEIKEGIFSSKSTIIGKVHLKTKYEDTTDFSFFNRDLPVVGIPDVALYLENGSRVVTDKNGKFSIPEVGSWNHEICDCSQGVK